MNYLEQFIQIIKGELPIVIAVATVLVIILVINIFIRIFKRGLLKKAKTKIQISNIKIFARILNITLISLVILFAFFSYIGSWTGLGVVAGLLTAALGFALQKPITGIAAWLMVITKRPFNIGDRIMIGNVKGDVYDISLTHLYLDEIGGTVESDDHSGRNVMIPNHFLFDNNIINYTLIHDYILGEVVVGVTYESDLDKAINIAKASAEKYAKEYTRGLNKEIKVRVFMDASSINLKVRFFAPVKEMQRVKSDITIEIYKRIKEEPTVDIAYPHTEMIINNKKNPLTEKK